MVPLFGLLLVSYFSASKSVEVITRSQSMRDGETVLSARKTYEMGFFSPGPEVVVWVANRENPLENSTGVLRMDEQGRLLLLDKEAGKVLLDSGNLEVRDGEKDLPAGLLWQSIDEPSHVMLPGMKMSANRRTGARRHLTSWKSPDDPSPGNYTVEMDFSTLPRVLLKHHQAIKFSTGHFNGYRFVGVPFMQPESVLQCVVRITEDQADYIIQMKIPTISIMTLSYNGVGQRLLYDEGTNVWETFTYLPADECDRFANCGAFSICNMSNFPVCGCLEGYAPRNGDEWDQQNFSSGCVRRTRPDCSGGDGFLLMPLLKLPHLINSTVDIDISLSECRNKCTSDCSCTAYAIANVTDGMGDALLGSAIFWI
ncbi:unnamed protein product [Spirodela intermedia]|uniref:Apple domain-containing protein n=1 Tax=Spirodela intermedia TaxID=51605 RepID=A0A7I8IKD8_SPIIN|nr:unnamed protein product [Spirodela intermedia]CAA6658360.1 unnamed protein product [Spirodela intermedia]